MTAKTKTILSIVLFCVVFAALLTVATFTDLQVSHILTKNALEDGEYIANDFFGEMFEIIGSSPVYLIASLCLTFLFWYCFKAMKLRPLREILCTIFFIGGVVGFWFYMKDVIGYSAEHIGAAVGASAADIRGAYDFAKSAQFVGVEFVTALMLNTLLVLVFKNLSVETLRKLAKFVVAFVLMALIANVIVLLVKDPVGRMRYRSMNSEAGQAMGGFANFTRWYEMTDNNALYDEEFCNATFGAKDAFKSFPSGHTSAAGMTYAFIMLIDVLDIKSKWKKVAIWGGALAWTGLTAISRIVVGAHFFSDVLMGGTLAFVSMIVAREIVIFKFAHIKGLFAKKDKSADVKAIEE